MKYPKLFSLLFFFLAFIFSACDNDGEGHSDGHSEDETEYTIAIMSPGTDDLAVGEMFHIHVNFDEAKMNTIHHVKITITNKESGDVIYTKPDVAHVMEASGHYEHHDDVMMDVEAGTQWILEAKVWGHEAGAHEISERVEFNVK